MAAPISVVHAEWGRHWSGGTKQVALLIEGLAQQEVDNLLVCPEGSAIAERMNGRVRMKPFRLRGEHDVPAWWRLASWLRNYCQQRDVSSRLLLHVHSRRGALPTLLIGRWLQLPTILHWRVAAPLPPLTKRLVDAVIAISEAAAAQARRAGVPEEQIHLVYSAIDPTNFFPPPEAKQQARQQFGLSKDAFVVAAAGRLVAGKGFDVLINGVALLPLKDRPIVLLAGDGEERTKLAQLAATLGLSEQVCFCGFLPDVRPVLWAADVFVHVPTSFPEGLSVAILEAMAAGLPVIGSSVGGIPELVRHEQTGLLVPPNEPEALAVALAKLRNDRALRDALGQQAQQWVRTHHDIAQLPLRVRRIYEKVCAFCSTQRSL